MIIGIDGYAGAGKDTVADILVTQGFTKVSFADKLRRVASDSFEVPIEYFLDRNLKDKPFDKPKLITSAQLGDFCVSLGFEDKAEEVIEKFKNLKVLTPRNLLQQVATEIGRDTLSPTIWLDFYKQAIDGLSLVVTPDARFDNEKELIRQLKGRVMFVSNKNVEPTETHKSGSEKWPLDKYDIVVHNDGTWIQLQYEVSLWWVMDGCKK